MPQAPAVADRRLQPGRAALRYFLDTEYNGVGGALLSLALVPDDGDELYLTFRADDPIVDWVQQHVVPFLDMVPEQLKCPRLSRHDAVHALERYLRHDEEPLIFADWPEDIARPAAPFSSDATRCSRTSVVGFMMRV